MKDYKKPRCDCGTALKAVRTEYWRVTRNITANGEVSDNVVKLHTSFDDSDYQIRLECSKCGKTYESDYDTKDRIIRGEEIN